MLQHNSDINAVITVILEYMKSLTVPRSWYNIWVKPLKNKRAIKSPSHHHFEQPQFPHHYELVWLVESDQRLRIIRFTMRFNMIINISGFIRILLQGTARHVHTWVNTWSDEGTLLEWLMYVHDALSLSKNLTRHLLDENFDDLNEWY